ncbi:HTH-type transcriptional regulator PrtR [compost metagenome]
MPDSSFDAEFDYDGFATRLAEAIAPEKLSHFAARSGVPQGTLHKYLRAGGGFGPRLDIVARMASTVGVSIDWLVYARGDGQVDQDTVKIPRYDATLAAGAGSWNDGKRRLDDIPFTRSFLQKRLGRTSTAGLSMLEAAGDSMEPHILDGDLLMIDENDRRLADGIFAFVLDEDARVKRFRRTFDGVTIISDNPAYPEEHLSADQLGRLNLIGRVRWFGRVT